MKFFFPLFLALSSLFSYAQQKETPIPLYFHGKWITDEESIKLVEISDEDVYVRAGNFMLHINCTATMKKDTVLLYIDGIDAHGGFPRNWIPPNKKFFAKCYILNKKLFIKYTQTVSRYKIKEMDLPLKLYKQSNIPIEYH